MYKITLLFESSIEGIYTKEEETATDMEHVLKKLIRMIERWVKILLPHVKLEDHPSLQCIDDYMPLTIDVDVFKVLKETLPQILKTALLLISCHLDVLNKYSVNKNDRDATFNIEILEIGADYCNCSYCSDCSDTE